MLLFLLSGFLFVESVQTDSLLFEELLGLDTNLRLPEGKLGCRGGALLAVIVHHHSGLVHSVLLCALP